ncbi:MAG: tRNA uridine-5-carboxymethylaminomethyl(34) synthesis GTPase MnmE [Myxococcales bacterium]|nr:tRNA uridine-5-carboxymethylaminomethyl(34) synthesis GTPase MnmE [Myxococcota bacterium]MDW8280645.1 tRNA uridine-5-carboxymethylaminomethyl(34) synthesis GTPase MnmE [Myxococcales bacterium]
MSTPRATIAAIASGVGGGIGIIRVSGPLAETIGARICTPWPQVVESHRMYPGWVVRPGEGGAPLDRVMFCLMRGPRSYTGEDVLEIYGHGGRYNMAQLLGVVLEAGAEMAAPGEFTRRAFLAGKLDLTQVEAVAASVGARSEAELRQARRQLHGELGAVVREIRRRVVSLLGQLEGALDFPDLEEDSALLSQLRSEIERLEPEVEKWASGFRWGGRVLSQGLYLAVVGQTNAGKSSLVNALCGMERVLVDAQPGTTRDYVEVHTSWDGLEVTLVDSAGYRTGETELEQQGLRLARARWAQADLLLLVVDGTRGLNPEDHQLMASPGPPCLVVWNKLDQHLCQDPPSGLSHPLVRCSALCGWGLDELRKQVLAMLAPQREDPGLLVTSARQAHLFGEAAAALGRARSTLGEGMDPALAAADLRICVARLGEITGEEASPAVLDAIFKKFCVGK